MAFGVKRITNNKIDTDVLKLGDILGCKIIPNEIGWGVDKLQEVECIINDFVKFDDMYIPTVIFLHDEDCILRLNDKRIKSFEKLGELNNTHILTPYSIHGYNDINVKVNDIRRIK